MRRRAAPIFGWVRPWFNKNDDPRRNTPFVLALSVRQRYASTGVCSSIPKSLSTFREPCPPRSAGAVFVL